jgi:xanthine dehydrogenase YagS FAD-binding subunit
MRDFSYQRATTVAAARQALAASGMLLAGGTSLLDLAKCGIAQPARVVDITRIPGLDAISIGADAVVIGALATMSRVAGDVDMRSQFPAVTGALSQAASPQIRNMASIAGNLMQRTRCCYFRDSATFPACNKRDPGTGCAAIGGVTRNHAVLGTSAACIATYPGDLAVALVAFDAVILLGNREVTAEDFFLLPGTTPEREHALEPDEMITAIRIPFSAAARRSVYLKVRDRQSYEFAAASAAVGLALEPDGRTIRDIRVALGGVASKPWRAHGVEAALRGQALEPAAVQRASLLAVEGAVDHGANRFKIDLAPRIVARAILQMGEVA